MDYYRTSNLMLNLEESFLFNDFYLNANRYTNKDIIPIYRGDNLKNLQNKLGIDSSTNSITDELLDRLFMVGEKSRSFYSSDIKINRFRIDDYSDEIFDYIFNQINNTIKNTNTDVKNFFEANTLFKRFFIEKNNKSLFKSIINSTSPSERFLIRNYYFSVLHQLGAVNYKKKSHLVSTSRNYTVASKFANSEIGEQPIILHCWRPTYYSLNLFKKYNLPKHRRPPFIYQDEESILAGILPHYIIGLETIDDNRFFVNSHILLNPTNRSTFINGIDIDQREFEETRRLTRYAKSVQTDGINYIESSD